MSETLWAVLLGGIVAFIPQLIILGIQNSRQNKEKQVAYLQAKKSLYLIELREIATMLATKDMKLYSVIFSKELILDTPLIVYEEEISAYIEGLNKFKNKEIDEADLNEIEGKFVQKIGLHVLNLDKEMKRLLDL